MKPHSSRRFIKWQMNGNWRCRCIQNIAHCRWSGTCRLCLLFSLQQTRVSWVATAFCQTSKARQIPVQYLANLLTAGDTKPVLRALKRMLAMRHYKRVLTVDQKSIPVRWKRSVWTEAQAGKMYRYLAIANYEDRFVVPSSHRDGWKPSRRKMAAALPLVMAATVQIPNSICSEQPSYRCH